MTAARPRNGALRAATRNDPNRLRIRKREGERLKRAWVRARRKAADRRDQAGGEPAPAHSLLLHEQTNPNSPPSGGGLKTCAPAGAVDPACRTQEIRRRKLR